MLIDSRLPAFEKLHWQLYPTVKKVMRSIHQVSSVVTMNEEG